MHLYLTQTNGTWKHHKVDHIKELEPRAHCFKHASSPIISHESGGNGSVDKVCDLTVEPCAQPQQEGSGFPLCRSE